MNEKCVVAQMIERWRWELTLSEARVRFLLQLKICPCTMMTRKSVKRSIFEKPYLINNKRQKTTYI